MSNCPTLSDDVFQDEGCKPSFAGLGSKVYIGTAASVANGTIPKMENMIAVERVGNLHYPEKEDNTEWNPACHTLSFTVRTTPEDRKKQRKLFDRLFGTAGLTRKCIVRERKLYNRYRRNVKNPVRRMIPHYKESQHKGLIQSLLQGVCAAKAKLNDNR